MNRHNNCCSPCGPCSPLLCPPVSCGPTGATGPAGPTGPTGLQGPTGAAGQSAFEAAQQGGYTGTEAQFYMNLANISEAILSSTIRINQVVTMEQYQILRALGELDPNTAYDIIEDTP